MTVSDVKYSFSLYSSSLIDCIESKPTPPNEFSFLHSKPFWLNETYGFLKTGSYYALFGKTALFSIFKGESECLVGDSIFVSRSLSNMLSYTESFSKFIYGEFENENPAFGFLSSLFLDSYYKGISSYDWLCY